MKRLVFDLDGTLTSDTREKYDEVSPNHDVVEKLKQYKNDGWEIIISTARSMRTYDNNIGKINANTLPDVINWLDKYDIPYDEIYVGKAWCGHDGFYIDDKAVRPSEFVCLSFEEIKHLLEKECKC